MILDAETRRKTRRTSVEEGQNLRARRKRRHTASRSSSRCVAEFDATRTKNQRGAEVSGESRRERRDKRREGILRDGRGGFMGSARAGSGRRTGSRAHREAERAGGRGRVRRWGGSAGVVRGCFRRDSGSPSSTGSFGLAGKWFGLVRLGPPKWVRLVTRGGGV